MDFSQPDQTAQYEPIGPGSTPKAGGGAEISEGPCDLCGQGPASVQRYMWVISFVLMTRHMEYAANLCRACSTRTGLKEQAKSALFGWWGIPWGLMTFKALWVNARTLARWSTLPAVVGLGTLLLGLLIPATVGYSIYVGSTEERQARQTGDWVDEEVVALMEQGHAHYDAGRLEQAAASYRAAHEKAPGSSVVNASLAQTLIDLGRLDEALPVAEAAARLDPETPAWTAMHGWLRARLQGPDAAKAQVAALRHAVPGDSYDAVWMADLFDAVGEWDQLLRSARAGLALEPGSPYLGARELFALVELDRLEEAAAIVDTLDEETLSIPYMAYSRDVYRMRTEPLAETGRLCSRWIDLGYTDDGMAGFVRAAERTGQLDEVRAEIRRWLGDPETPGDAWASAEPWFADQWTEELDRYLDKRPEPGPALIRLALYDPVIEAEPIRRLASRVGPDDHPLAQFVDMFLYGPGAGGEPLARRAARIEEHLESAPDHVLCRSLLAALLARSAPERAAAELQVLDEAAQENPALAAVNVLERAEVHLALGEVDDALATIADLDPGSAQPYAGPGRIDLMAAEAAFHAGNIPVCKERLGRLIQGDDGGAHAAGLLVQWSQQLAAGGGITYREDVDRLLERHGDDLLTEQSTSAQAILVAEGRVDRREREALTPLERLGTLELVRIFREAAETGTPDLEALERLAGSPYATQFAPLLARTALERRSRREGS